MITKPAKNVTRRKRHKRVRKAISGTPECPRLNVFRSNKHIYAQLIDDRNGSTVASASTNDKNLNVEVSGNEEAAKTVGDALGKSAVEKGYKAVVFDRGGYRYHGRVKALADAARDAGLEF